MTTPQRFGDIAAVILADLWHNQPQGDPMTEPDEYTVTEYELRSAHAVVDLDRPENDPAPAEETAR